MAYECVEIGIASQICFAELSQLGDYPDPVGGRPVAQAKFNMLAC